MGGLYNEIHGAAFCAKTMRGVVWLRMYGGVPELVKVAIRALSAPTAVGAGEEKWSTYGFIVSRPGNKASALRAKKLVFVHYNFWTTRGSLAR